MNDPKEYTNKMTLERILSDCNETLETAHTFGTIPDEVAICNEINVLKSIRERYIEMFTESPELMD